MEKLELKEFCGKLIKLKNKDIHKFYELKRIMEELLLSQNKDLNISIKEQ